MIQPVEGIREIVRSRYAEAASQTALHFSCCDGTAGEDERDADGNIVFGSELYGSAAAELSGSLGCGVPTEVADLHPGETVLDLGSGAGGDVLLAARRVGEEGRVIGLDMTAEMLDLARSKAEAAGVTNVEFVQGYLEAIPLPDDSIDIALSNCVLNLAADKDLV
ncbi:MAG: methyltransferase domain-containing protein, partial [Micrococcales bacterium]|nr:methyltransferase domain-containing protein [Micrococcales bacterium]